LLGWLTQSLHEQRQKKTPSNNTFQPVHINMRGIWTFLVWFTLVCFITLILVETDQCWYSYGKYSIGKTPFQRKTSVSLKTLKMALRS